MKSQLFTKTKDFSAFRIVRVYLCHFFLSSIFLNPTRLAFRRKTYLMLTHNKLKSKTNTPKMKITANLVIFCAHIKSTSRCSRIFSPPFLGLKNKSPLQSISALKRASLPYKKNSSFRKLHSKRGQRCPSNSYLNRQWLRLNKIYNLPRALSNYFFN